MNILNSILAQAKNNPHSAAVIQLHKTDDGNYKETVLYDYGTLIDEAGQLGCLLSQRTASRAHIGIVMGNTPEWVLADLALLLAERVEVPVPLSFSSDQAEHLLQNCNIVLTDDIGAARLAEWQINGLKLMGKTLPIACGQTPVPKQILQPIFQQQFQNDSVIKIIHTSGTTSHPKGVKIRRKGLDALITALWQCVQCNDYRRYLNLVPLSLLIEQVTALYMPLTSGVGESIITVFERRLKALDPMQHSFLTRLLHFHGLDEARHIQCDHAIFDQIIPTFTRAEHQRMQQLIQETESLNTQLAMSSAETVKSAFDLDYTEGNIAAATQLDMTLRFREIVQSGETIRKVDDYMDDETAAIVQQFSQASKVHKTQFSNKL